MNDELRGFVRDALGRGLPREAIRAVLRQASWRPDEIEAALAAYAEADFPVPVPRRRPSLSAREAFLYLVLFATLYTSAYNTGQVLFALIELWLPDPLRGPYQWHPYIEWVRGGTAGLVIAFPVFLLLSRVIGREVAREPERRGSPVRKWLTYLTLFVAAVVIIGDLTMLVTRVLGGELATSFLLKVLVVALISGTVFGHYLGDLRREEGSATPARPGTALGARAAAGAVFAVMAAGLVLSGSPQAERGRKLDTQRIEALQRIQHAMRGYYDARHRLPEALDSLLYVPDGVTAETLLDPATRRPIEYRALDSLAFELCVEFQAAGDAQGSRGRQSPYVSPFGSEFWRHEAGRKCFRFDVAPRGR